MGTRKHVVLCVCLPKVQSGFTKVNYSQWGSFRKTGRRCRIRLLLNWLYILFCTFRRDYVTFAEQQPLKVT